MTDTKNILPSCSRQRLLFIIQCASEKMSYTCLGSSLFACLRSLHFILRSFTLNTSDKRL